MTETLTIKNCQQNQRKAMFYGSKYALSPMVYLSRWITNHSTLAAIESSPHNSEQLKQLGHFNTTQTTQLT